MAYPMSLPFVDAIFDMLGRRELSAASGCDILANAIAPTFMIGSPAGLFQWVDSYFLATLTAVEKGTRDGKVCKSAVNRIFELMALNDFDRLNAIRRATGG